MAIPLGVFQKRIEFLISNRLYTANNRELGRCTRNEHDTSRLLLYFDLYTNRLSGFVSVF